MLPFPLLSICIPTYNRPYEFTRLLLQVLQQTTYFRDLIEIVIVDDSDDENSKAYSLLKDSGVIFKYFRGDANGIDIAILKIMKESSGEFIWWCGDDDEISQKFLETVINILQHSRIYLDFIFISYTIEKNLNSSKIHYEFMSPNKIFEIAGVDLTLLSSGVFRRVSGSKGIDLANKYKGSAFASQPILLSAIFNSDSDNSCCLIYTPLLINNPTVLNKDGLFYDGVNAFGVTYWNILHDFQGLINKKLIFKFLKRNFSHIWRGLIIDWIKRDIPAPRNRLWELRSYRVFPEYWFALIIMNQPKIIIIFLYKVYKFFFPKHFRAK